MMFATLNLFLPLLTLLIASELANSQQFKPTANDMTILLTDRRDRGHKHRDCKQDKSSSASRSPGKGANKEKWLKLNQSQKKGQHASQWKTEKVSKFTNHTSQGEYKLLHHGHLGTESDNQQSHRDKLMKPANFRLNRPSNNHVNVVSIADQRETQQQKNQRLIAAGQNIRKKINRLREYEQSKKKRKSKDKKSNGDQKYKIYLIDNSHGKWNKKQDNKKKKGATISNKKKKHQNIRIVLLER